MNSPTFATPIDLDFVHLVTYSARKGGAQIIKENDGGKMRFVFRGPNGEINAGEFCDDPQAALVSACKALYAARPM